MSLLRRLIVLLDKIDRRFSAGAINATPQDRQISVEDLQGETLDFVSPCFVLSTGRCGTLWLSELLQFSSRVYVNHSDSPELIRHSRLAYEHHQENPCLFQEIVRAARDEWIVNAYRRSQIYVETNNRITFFAHALKHVYPKARFVHLVRHPGDFVRSGLSRGWYQGHIHDVGRIVMKDKERWQSLSDIEKIAWLWNETNQYIEAVLRTLPAEDYIQVRAEDMFAQATTVSAVCEFVGAYDISLREIDTMMKRTVNPQRVWKVSAYDTWPSEDKRALRNFVTALDYDYTL